VTTVVPLLTVDEVAVILGKAPRWVRVQAKAAQLPAKRIGGTWRFEPGAIQKYIRDATDGAVVAAKDKAQGRRRTPP
jgi:hypothetical protein